jgi:hypothetical protein
MLAYCYRLIFECCRRVNQTLFREPEPELNYTVPVSKLPWLWIGAQFENHVVDCTELVNASFIEPSTLVNKEWLEAATNSKPISWTYLDSESLEEKDFPSAGFVIDDSESEEAEDSDSGDANADHTE